VSLVRQTSDLQGRLAIAERNLRLSREYLKVIMGETGEEVPGDCQKVLNRIRFVGTRLGDACLQILQDKRSVTSQEMLDELNSGQFRFRTGSPLREINAALLRQPRAKRDGDRWMYVPKSKRRRGEVA
jgi:hypothetical protein